MPRTKCLLSIFCERSLTGISSIHFIDEKKARGAEENRKRRGVTEKIDGSVLVRGDVTKSRELSFLTVIICMKNVAALVERDPLRDSSRNIFRW